MIEITPGEALDLHLKGEPVYVMVPFDDTFHIATLKKCRCFKDEAVELKEKVEELAGQSEAKPKEEPKRAPRGTRETRTTAKPKIDHGKILALHKAKWPVQKIADEMGIANQTVRNHIDRAVASGEL